MTEKSFSQRVETGLGAPLCASTLSVVQVNVGLLCNLCCTHCHVAAGPERSEVMSWETMQSVLALLQKAPAALLDITGGAPEMNKNLMRLITEARALGNPIQVRTNLSVLLEPGMEGFPKFFAENRVALVASLPCYLNENVDKQRGDGSFSGSIAAIRLLNAIGYGVAGGMPLSLVYNPSGPFLPPGQKVLEADYRRELRTGHQVEFTNLLTVANMPIGRFLQDLRTEEREQEYYDLLVESYNPETLEGLMCCHQINVAWDGSLYDCDFNQALGIPVSDGSPQQIAETNPNNLIGRKIATGKHCFGCTAGAGSSCGGALVA